MSDPEIGWHFKVRRAHHRAGKEWLAWAACTPELGDGPLDVDWREDVRFAFGVTAEEALAKLRREISH